MNEKQVMTLYGSSPTALLSSLISTMAKEEAKLTPEEKVERNKRFRANEVQKLIRLKIQKGICPNCDGKLIRGKKDKKNEYKRAWDCGECKRKYHM